MRAVLAEDVIQVADGGGNVSAARQPIVGRTNVIRLFEGVRTKFWSDLEFRLATVNAQPGILMLRPDGSVYGAVALDFEDGRICALYAVLNPDKLARTNRR
jgi:RNA polymerase sigma-70 factor, ECF subfamily